MDFLEVYIYQWAKDCGVRPLIVSKAIVRDKHLPIRPIILLFHKGVPFFAIDPDAYIVVGLLCSSIPGDWTVQKRGWRKEVAQEF